MTEFYRGRTALVTGASSGIGADMARQLAEAGAARVVLVARREGALEAVAAEVRRRGAEAVVLPADLEAPDAAAALVARLGEAGAEVDVLVNNAGFGLQGKLAEMPVEGVEGMVALNVAALTSLTRRLLPGMVARRRGGVLNVASLASFAPAPYFAVYAATKAYVLSFSEALAGEARSAGDRVTALCPGPVATGFGDRAGMKAGFFSGGPSSEAVARAGLGALAAGRMRVVPGWAMKLQAFGTRLVPRDVVVRVAGSRMKEAS